MLSRGNIARFWRKIGAAESGAVAVELAYVLPVIIVLCLGVAEGSRAISHQLTIQAAARAATSYSLIKPPIQNDTTAITNAAKSVLPTSWLSESGTAPTVTSTLSCQCELTGAVACGGTCSSGEKMQSYITVDVRKTYKPFLKVEWMPTFTLEDTSIARLQ